MKLHKIVFFCLKVTNVYSYLQKKMKLFLYLVLTRAVLPNLIGNNEQHYTANNIHFYTLFLKIIPNTAHFGPARSTNYPSQHITVLWKVICTQVLNKGASSLLVCSSWERTMGLCPHVLFSFFEAHVLINPGPPGMLRNLQGFLSANERHPT